MAVEDHLGKPLAELAEIHLFGPLGLKHTTMHQPGEPGFPENAAKVHNSRGAVISGGLPICPQISLAVGFEVQPKRQGRAATSLGLVTLSWRAQA